MECLHTRPPFSDLTVCRMGIELVKTNLLSQALLTQFELGRKLQIYIEVGTRSGSWSSSTGKRCFSCLILPTGYSKSLIYQMFVRAKEFAYL